MLPVMTVVRNVGPDDQRMRSTSSLALWEASMVNRPFLFWLYQYITAKAAINATNSRTSPRPTTGWSRRGLVDGVLWPSIS